MKGISEIIATVLILMIVVGLAGTVFVYLQSSLTGRVAKQVDLIDVSCNTTHVFATAKNFDPKLILTVASDISVFLNGAPVALAPADWTSPTIAAGSSETVTLTCSSCPQGTSVAVKVVGPSNSVERSVVC
ncbi:MAG TPA: archaellin/type IV pilin N-terminal domain-containing protein [archaeon]|nr:archaellin/type IV pilin N-terminal domain-containing protein [archaeon]